MSVADDLIQQLNTLLSVWGSIYHLTFWFQPDQYPEARIFATLTYESTDEKPDMNQDRRDFFRNIGTKTAGIAVSIATPAIAHTAALSEQIGNATTELNHKLSEATSRLNKQVTSAVSEIGEQVSGLSNRIDTSALMLSYQQIQINIIFMLLILSFAIDGGMSFFWAFYG